MKYQLARFITLFFLLSASNTQGQSDLSVKSGIEIGKKYSFYSKILDEERELWIRVPNGYIVDDTSRYPVVYLLDGNNNFIFTAGLLRQLEIRSVPKSILVGIINTDRSRDLTPPPSEKESGVGGADQFLEMLDKELFSYVKANFRTKDFRTLIGHSYGGLLAVYALAKDPDLFNAYLAISPSLWWDEQKVVDFFGKSLRKNPETKAMLYMTMASERGKMLGGLLKLVGILESENPKNLRWAYKVHPNEHHGSIPTISSLEGFHFFYKDWHIPGKEFEDYGLEVIAPRKARIKKEFGETWEPENIIYDDMLWDFIESRHFERAIALSERLIDSGKKVPDFHETAAIAYMNLNQPEKAKYHYKKMYQLNPGYQDGADMLDSLGMDKKRLLNPPSLAAQDLEKYVGYYSDGENKARITIVEGILKLHLKEPYFNIDSPLKVFKEHHFYVPDNYYTIQFLFGRNQDQATHLKVMETTGWSNLLIRLE
ncbi:MAG: alpha/beta hydrolase-fold protein [Bacteroidota bacterium]